MIKNLTFYTRGGGKMAMSPIAEAGTNYLINKATELGATVLREKTPKAARTYIGWIAELHPSVYSPKGELETALDLAVGDTLQAGLSPRELRNNYLFFRQMAKLYGLDDRARLYNAEIAKLDGSLR